uniref:Uncharacterized protein n=1 Tax=Gouania willdenowi TaxID=441366 RepID=A0A8C5EPS7_GOUWI
MSASETPKSRLETRSFPPVSTPPPPMHHNLNRSLKSSSQTGYEHCPLFLPSVPPKALHPRLQSGDRQEPRSLQRCTSSPGPLKQFLTRPASKKRGLHHDVKCPYVGSRTMK